MSAPGTPRAQPFHCPYCGLEDLVPEEEEGAWRCESCRRAFTLRFLGVRELRP
jgi:ribosomal protein L37AE/L43A